jgi:ATP-dependent Clp protease ATP-binding subunit ClpB
VTLPVWLTDGNDDVRKITVPLPEFGVRETAARWLAGALNRYRDATEENKRDLERRLAKQTREPRCGTTTGRSARGLPGPPGR